MAVSMSKSEIYTFLDKKLTNFDEKRCRDVDEFPVNFSGVPHIGAKIFGFLDFKDLDNCNNVCKGWYNFLHEKRALWMELLEKERIKLESSVNYDSDDFSDCSDDSLGSDDIWQIWQEHINEHEQIFSSSDEEEEEEEECDERYVCYVFTCLFF